MTSATVAKNSCRLLDGLRPYSLLRASAALNALSALPATCSLYRSPWSMMTPRILTDWLGSIVSCLNYMYRPLCLPSIALAAPNVEVDKRSNNEIVCISLVVTAIDQCYSNSDIMSFSTHFPSKLRVIMTNR
jgi:hypothetical protein